MWPLSIATIAVVYQIAALWCDRTTGAVAAILLVTCSQYTDVMLEFRPDVPAVLCLLLSIALWVESSTSTHRHRSARSGW